MRRLGFVRKETPMTIVPNFVVTALTCFGFAVILYDLTLEQRFKRTDFWKKRNRKWVEYEIKRHRIEESQSRALMEEIKLLSATAPVDADRYNLVNEAARKVFNRSS